jgi:hypothetical protein
LEAALPSVDPWIFHGLMEIQWVQHLDFLLKFDRLKAANHI